MHKLCLADLLPSISDGLSTRFSFQVLHVVWHEVLDLFHLKNHVIA
uniref:Uncharacterized protein n=1 Tax=Aegilops tauschii subsp. strangulata TaxID=200361 RepID=A0A453IWB2_AEGTS